MKSKEQKRREAIERAVRSYEEKNWQRYGIGLQEYLNKFKRHEDRVDEVPA